MRGSENRGYSGDGGPAVKARLSFPSGVAADNAGNVYITDTGNNRVRRIDTTGTITTIAGTGEGGYDWEGPAVEAKLAGPRGVALDDVGNLYIHRQHTTLGFVGWMPRGSMSRGCGIR